VNKHVNGECPVTVRDPCRLDLSIVYNSYENQKSVIVQFNRQYRNSVENSFQQNFYNNKRYKSWPNVKKDDQTIQKLTKRLKSWQNVTKVDQKL
jgi:hypothetical protein